MKTNDDERMDIERLLTSTQYKHFRERLLRSEHIGMFIGFLMQEQGLTYEKVGRAIGMNRGTVHCMVAGQFKPERDVVLVLFFEVFGLPKLQIYLALLYFEYPSLFSRAQALKLLEYLRTQDKVEIRSKAKIKIEHQTNQVLENLLATGRRHEADEADEAACSCSCSARVCILQSLQT